MRGFSDLLWGVCALMTLNFQTIVAEPSETKEEKKTPTLVLTDTVRSTGPTVSSVANISNDGDKVFGFFVGGGETPPPGLIPQPPFTEARLFKNEKGKLEAKRTLFIDESSPFTFSVAGAASPDFERFVVIEQGPPTSPTSVGTTRIRVLNDDFNVLATTIVDNSFVQGFPGQQPIFTEDGKFFVVNLQVADQLILRVLQTKNLSAVFDYIIGSAATIDSESPTYFRLRKKNEKIQEFFAFSNTVADNQGFPISATLQILKFKRDSSQMLTLVSETPLPQDAFSVTGLRLPNQRLLPFGILSVGTIRADLKGEKITFEVPRFSLLPQDGDELRIYHFDGTFGKEAKLVASKNVKMDTTATALNPADLGRTVATSVRNMPFGAFFNPNPPPDPGFDPWDGMFHLQQITPESRTGVAPQGIKEVDQMYPVGSEARVCQFSQDGKWLVVCSSKGFQNVPDTPDTVFLGVTQNIQLFRVKHK